MNQSQRNYLSRRIRNEISRFKREFWEKNRSTKKPDIPTTLVKKIEKEARLRDEIKADIEKFAEKTGWRLNWMYNDYTKHTTYHVVSDTGCTTLVPLELERKIENLRKNTEDKIMLGSSKEALETLENFQKELESIV